MFGFLKPFLRKLVEAPVETEPTPEPDYFPENFPSNGPSAAPRAVTPSRDHHQNNRLPASRPGSRGVELPLQPIIQSLPLELQPRVLYPEVGDAVISVPLEKILAQLARGVVKISFGELRLAAPGIFSVDTDRDRVLVPLPLQEILSRLNPALITRRRTQKQIEVPAEISSPFDLQGQGLIFSVGPGKAEPAPGSGPAPRQTTPAPVHSISAARGGLTSTPTPPPPGAVPMSSAIPISPLSNTPAPRIARESAPSQPAAIPFSLGPKPAPAIAPAPAAAPLAPQPAQPAKPVLEAAPLLVSLIALAEAWPEAVRKEIVQWNLVDARVSLPADAVEQALKQGRISFSWKSVRSWLTPAVLAQSSPLDATVVELPLKVVAPLFLARQREASESRQKVAIDTEIPNLFFGLPQADAPADATPADSSAVAKPVDTNYYIWDDSSESARIDASEYKRPPSLETRFISRCATPNEVVSKAAALDSVEGALIALPDGLMVASQLSPDLNGDTIAAFLPQIFSKVSQCTKELRMGELNNLNFTVGNVPWKIFRVNAIFFAAFGRAGEALPTAQLAALASELDHKSK
jgi:predicted regulator of Ras-like GTPase activity (Roadblock/LC7/MglB family)